jgi:hypothetical protein
VSVTTISFNSAGTWEHIPDRTIGKESQIVRNRLRGAIDTERSIAFGGSYWDLRSACLEAVNPNWDGYGATPVTPATYTRATSFLAALPLTIPSPEIAIDPDGEVSFRWQTTPEDVLSVSVSDNGRVSYAALFGNEDAHGTTFFHDEIPAMVSANLARLFRPWR